MHHMHSIRYFAVQKLGLLGQQIVGDELNIAPVLQLLGGHDEHLVPDY